jgi:hypothetical protein
LLIHFSLLCSFHFQQSVPLLLYTLHFHFCVSSILCPYFFTYTKRILPFPSLHYVPHFSVYSTFFIFCSSTCLRPIIKLLFSHLSLLLCTLRNTGRAGLRKVQKHPTRSHLYTLLLVFSAFRSSTYFSTSYSLIL